MELITYPLPSKKILSTPIGTGDHGRIRSGESLPVIGDGSNDRQRHDTVTLQITPNSIGPSNDKAQISGIEFKATALINEDGDAEDL